MNREYDIFERLPDGTDLWKDYAHGLEQARRKLQEFAAQSKNELYAIHTPTKEIAARVNVRQPWAACSALRGRKRERPD